MPLLPGASVIAGDHQTAVSKSRSGKRKEEPAQIEQRPLKKQCPNFSTASADASTRWKALTGDEVQMAKYINEMMSHGARNYATGWLLQETKMTLWYADRMGLVHSAPFDIFVDPHLLLLFVAAVTSADLQKLGFCPLLTPSSRMVTQKKFEGYEGAVLGLSEPVLDEEGKGVDGGELTFDVDQEHPIQTDLGTVGRGTTIVYVKASGMAATLFGPSRLIAKIAWPVFMRHGEDNFIRKIRTRLQENKPEYLKHIVDLKASLSQRIEQVSLPRASMVDLPDVQNVEHRMFRCLVMEEYSPLETVRSVEEFKTIFVETVKGQALISVLYAIFDHN